MAEFSGRDRWYFVARAALSAVLIVACLYVILFKENPPDALTKWAIGIAGLIVGYWLR